MSSLTVYTTAWCGYCKRLTRQMDQSGVPYTSVDIEADEAAAQFVAGVNGGNRTVPTVVMPDGVTLTNPPIGRILERLDRA